MAVSAKKTLTFCLMDAPFEQARTITALRLIDLAIRRGHDVTVFAYEGAVALPFVRQKKHANALHGCTVEEEDHPLPREWIAALLDAAKRGGAKLDWINCGLCVDERGVDETVEGCRRGSPADFWNAAAKSDNTLVVATR
jgi:tRNA 2-thiouridine synthesizing protein D